MRGPKIWLVGQLTFDFVDSPNTTIFQVSAALLRWTVANISLLEAIELGDFYVVRYAFFLLVSLLNQLGYANLLKRLQNLLLFFRQSATYLFFCSAIVLTINPRQFSFALLLALKIVASTLTSSNILRRRTCLFCRNRRNQIEV